MLHDIGVSLLYLLWFHHYYILNITNKNQISCHKTSLRIFKNVFQRKKKYNKILHLTIMPLRRALLLDHLLESIINVTPNFAIS